MGIVNTTPDSFSDGGKYNSANKAIDRAYNLLENGADIIDIGAVSSRPFSKNISFLEEKNRLFPYLNEIIKKYKLDPQSISEEDLFNKKILKKSKGKLKLLNVGKPDNATNLQISFASKKAIEALEKLGGTIKLTKK